jgi:hypothetical protein
MVICLQTGVDPPALGKCPPPAAHPLPNVYVKGNRKRKEKKKGKLAKAAL